LGSCRSEAAVRRRRAVISASADQENGGGLQGIEEAAVAIHILSK
jgi:hypothetical protein